MAQLICIFEPRLAVAPVADRSGDHKYGDVVEIVEDYAVTAHYAKSGRFVVLSVPGDREDWTWLQEPLQSQETVINEDGEDIGPASILRKRYGILFDRLPQSLNAQLLATGSATVSAMMLEAVLENRSI